MARTGKIARLPVAIRTELNQRLRDGESGSTLLPWLNAQPEVVTVLRDQFKGAEINAQNLSDWRNGGYQEWVDQNDRLTRTSLLAERAVALAREAGGNLNDGASAIVSGRILEALEGMGEDAKLEDLIELSKTIALLRSGDADQTKIQQKNEQLKLAREAFEHKLREYQDKVAAQKREIESALGLAKAGGMTPETLQRIEEAARLL
jgi:hypothetical protein